MLKIVSYIQGSLHDRILGLIHFSLKPFQKWLMNAFETFQHTLTAKHQYALSPYCSLYIF